MSEIDFWTLPTNNGGPNAIKVAIILEELGLPYKPHIVDIMTGGQFKPEFLALTPNNKVPVIRDPVGPDGKEFVIWESGAILLYLAEKTGKLLSKDPTTRYQTLQWVFWQVACLGPMSGQSFHFEYQASEDVPYGKKRYSENVVHMLGVLETHMKDGRQYIVGDEFSIADIACFGWINFDFVVPKFKSFLTEDKFPNVRKWHKLISERPAVQKAQPLPYFK